MLRDALPLTLRPAHHYRKSKFNFKYVIVFYHPTRSFTGEANALLHFSPTRTPSYLQVILQGPHGRPRHRSRTDGEPQICGGGMLLPSSVGSGRSHQLLVSLRAVTSLQPRGGPGAYAPVETERKPLLRDTFMAFQEGAR